jgi:iron complex transport system ATP-binding protein
MLSVDKITVRIDQKTIIEDVSFDLAKNDFLMIVGPNGSGKTTLVKAIMNSIEHTGAAMLGNTCIRHMKSRALAREIGVLTQSHSTGFNYSVRDVVSLGRYAYSTGLFRTADDEDERMVSEAMEKTGVDHLAHRKIDSLSGGEVQRVYLAQLFAQDTSILILDEPTNHLDLQYQISIFDMIARWSREGDRAVIAIVHDLNLVYSFGTSAMLMKDGRVFKTGSVEETLSRENLKSVYNVDVQAWMKNLLKHWEKEENR